MRKEILSILKTCDYLTAEPFIPLILVYDIKESEQMKQFEVIEHLTYFKIMFKASKSGNYSNI